MKEKAQWIWYPSDYEFLLYNKVMTRRYERNYIITADWNAPYHYPNVKFTSTFTLTTTNKIYIKVEGKFNIAFFENNTLTYVRDFEQFIVLPKGKYTMIITVYNSKDLPCIFVESEELVSCAKTFTATCNDGDDKIVGCYNFYDKDKSPNTFALSKKELKYKNKVSVGENKNLYDFGEETFCTLEFLNVKNSAEVKIYYGESKEEALDCLECETLDVIFIDSHCNSIDNPKAFRWVMIDFGNLICDDIRGMYHFLPVDCKSNFVSSNTILNQIYSTAIHTLNLNMQEFFLDGIKRDRWIWSGDAIQCYLMDYYSFFELDCIKRTTVALGGRAPVKIFMNNIMDYSFYWIIALYDYYNYTKDLEFVKNNYEMIVNILEFSKSRINDNGFLVGTDKELVYIDCSYNLNNVGEVCAEQLLYAKSLFVASFFGKLLGYDNDFLSQYDNFLKKVNDVFWSNELGAYCYNRVNGIVLPDLKRQPNAIAIFFDLANEEQSQKIKTNVLLNLNVDKIISPYFKFYELSSLCKLGCNEFVLNEMVDYWGKMLEIGATSFWERFNPDEEGLNKYSMYGRKFGKSLCHAWGASPIFIIGKYFVGLRPKDIGYDEFILSPNKANLEWFNATLPTKNGQITVNYTNDFIEIFSDVNNGELVMEDKNIKQKIIAGKKYKIYF